MKRKTEKMKIYLTRTMLLVFTMMIALAAAACGAPSEVNIAPAARVEVSQEDSLPPEDEPQPQTGQPHRADLVFPGAEYLGKRAFSQADSEFFVTGASFQDVASFYNGLYPDTPGRHYDEENGYAYIQTELMQILMGDYELTAADIAALGRLVNIHIAADKDVGAVQATATQQILEQLPEDQTIIILTFTTLKY